MYAKFSFALLLLGSLFIVSCGDDDNDKKGCSPNWAAELTDELTAVQSAAEAYAEDPTGGNCNAYKDALQDYINELRPYRDCSALTGQNRTDFEAALADAEETLQDVCPG